MATQDGGFTVTTLADQDLRQLLAEGESDRVEFKETVGNAVDSIREAICAFANDLPGHGKLGVIFVGVRDNGTVIGLPVTDELLRQLADMKTDGTIVPPPSMTVGKRSLDGKDVAVVTVQPSDSPPVRYKGSIHVRTGPRRGTATTQDERILNEKRRYGDRPFDLHTIPITTVRDLNLSQFEYEYLPNAVSPEVLDANNRSREEQLAATKMIVSVDDPTPTVLGTLVLGKRTRDVLPGAYIQFLKINGTDIADDIIDNEEISGSVADILRRVDEKLRAHNQTAVDFTSGPVERRTSLYPMPALEQIVRNAVMHRTYEATNSPVQVYWFSDRIEVVNPGSPFGSVTADNFGQFGRVDYRNPNLAEALKILGFVQRFGAGIGIARRELERAGHPALEFQFPENFVCVIIRAVAK